MNNFVYYIICGIIIILSILLIKKVAGCLLKIVLLAITVALLVAVYFLFLK